MTAIPTHDRRVMVKAAPFNCEASLEALGELITPIEDFYVRSNFPTPPFGSIVAMTVASAGHLPVSRTVQHTASGFAGLWMGAFCRA